MNELHTEEGVMTEDGELHPLELPIEYNVDTSLIPGWWCWRSPITKQWHARKRGSQPPLVVHWDTLEGLREKARGHS
jgi:hypothetical protein